MLRLTPLRRCSFHSDSKIRHEIPLKFSSSLSSHYDLLGLPKSASHQEIKRKFKQLSKIYHPDIVVSNPEFEKLSSEDKKLNNENYIKLVQSYEVLSDTRQRASYDAGLGLSRDRGADSAREVNADNVYRTYGPTRTRVHYGHRYDPSVKSRFHGMPQGHGRHDVPHFDYDAHLKRQLKLEERMINRKKKEMGESEGDLMSQRRFQYVYSRMKE